MASRKPKTSPAPTAVTDPSVEQPVIHYIANPVTLAHATPKTRDEIALRDAVRKALSEVESLVAAFVIEKRSERLSDADLDELFVIELQLQLRYWNEDGRIRVSYDGQIVERQA